MKDNYKEYSINCRNFENKMICLNENNLGQQSQTELYYRIKCCTKVYCCKEGELLYKISTRLKNKTENNSTREAVLYQSERVKINSS